MISYTPFITWILVCSYENISMVTVSDVKGIKGALYLKSIHLCTCVGIVQMEIRVIPT